MKNLDFANKIAKISTEIHSFKTNLGNLVVGPLGSRQNFRNSTTGTGTQSVSSGHRVLNFESKTLSGESPWIGEKRLIDCGPCEFGTALREQHLTGARANKTFFR
jgi:hypothetical protein